MHAEPPLQHWHEFFLLVGTAAATLIALLFVAASIGVGWISPERSTGTRTFMTPVISHFTSVLFVSAITIIPTQTDMSLAALLVPTGLFGMICGIIITVLVVRRDDEWTDWFAYGGIPAAAYGMGALAGVLFWRHAAYAADVLAAAALLLLIVNIRNAWDLTIAMAHRHRGPPDST